MEKRTGIQDQIAPVRSSFRTRLSGYCEWEQAAPQAVSGATAQTVIIWQRRRVETLVRRSVTDSGAPFSQHAVSRVCRCLTFCFKSVNKWVIFQKTFVLQPTHCSEQERRKGTSFCRYSSNTALGTIGKFHQSSQSISNIDKMLSYRRETALQGAL